MTERKNANTVDRLSVVGSSRGRAVTTPCPKRTTHNRQPGRAAAFLLLLLIALPLHADFASIAKAIDAQHGVRRIWIPFLGLARMAVRMVEPEGVYDFQLVTFEGTDRIDPRKLQDIIRTQAGPGFLPLVQTWSRRSGEWSFIYARPSRNSNRLELIVLAHDHQDTVLVRVDVDAHKIAHELKDKPRDVSRVARR